VIGTTVDPDMAKAMKLYEGMPCEISIGQVEPEKLLSFRWHPNALERTVDYSGEPTTLVVFEVEEAPGGTMLRVTESGFDQLPLPRRTTAFEANERGWTTQMKLIEKHLARVE
jgi:uncharacterized protein YndB with AHSA1/START domain